MELTIIEKMEIPNKETIEAIEELKNGGGEVFEGSAHDFMQSLLSLDDEIKLNYV